MRFPLDHVCDGGSIDLKQLTEKDGANLDFRQPLPGKPRERKALGSIAAVMQNCQIQQRRPGFQARSKIKANLMIWPSLMAKEILGDTKRFLDMNGSANFLLHLTNDRLCGMFSGLDPAPGKTPEMVALYLMQ